MKIDLMCDFCHKYFKRYKSAVKKNKNSYFCSYPCFQKWRISQTTNHDFFDAIDTEEKAYWLGFLYADGSLTQSSKKQKSLVLSLSILDQKHVEKFAVIFQSKVKQYPHTKQGKTYYCATCTITSNQIWHDLNAKGLCPRKTYNDSDEILSAIKQKELINHFIRGYFDGDGGLSTSKNHVGGCNIHMIGTLKLLKSIRHILCTETKVSLPCIFPRKNTKVVHTLAWSGSKQILKIRDYLYYTANIYLERKYLQFKDIEQRLRRSERSHTSLYRGVSWNKRRQVFEAHIYHNRQLYYLGHFDTEIKAAKVYNQKVIDFKKPLYRLNNVQ